MIKARASVLLFGLAFFGIACSKDESAGTVDTTGASNAGGTTGNNCSADQTPCGQDCVNVATDRLNCGGCGIPCSMGQTCQGSICQCETGLVDCNGSCVVSDTTHCGNCTTKCVTGQICSGGACVDDSGTGGTGATGSGVSTDTGGATGGATAASTGGATGGASVTSTGGATGGASVTSTGGATGRDGGPSTGGATGTVTTGSSGTTTGRTTGTGTGATTGAAGTTGTTGASMPTLVTSTPGAYWKTDGQLTQAAASATADVTVDDATVSQTWEGFGGAFNEMGWNYLSMLSQADQDQAMSLLFGADGARFAIGRIPIGATDYSIDRYTLDETAGDTSLAGFSISRDMQRLIPFVKAAQAVKGNIRFWASPWTPPTWMKQGPFNDSYAFDGGTMKSDDATLKAFAQYLVKFVQAYGQEAISIETVSAQNEPGYSGTYPTCAWDPTVYAKFVGQYLGPAITTAGLTTKIMLGTFNNGTGDTNIVSSVMGDATAKSYIKVFGYQWGMRGNVASAKSYNLPIWQTEHQCGNYPWSTPFNSSTAPNDQAYGVETWGLIRDWIKAGVTAYSTWNMVLDTKGIGIDSMRVWPQDSLLVVDTSAKKLIITPAYYVFRHFSQFALPGAKVVATTGGDAIAFKNADGSIVAAMYNSGAAKTTTVSIAGKKLQFAMPATGWATVVAR